MKTFIYCIERIKTGKKYIGQHRGDIEDNYWGSGRAIKASIRKHGVDSFKKYVLAYCTEDEVDALETCYITEYNTFLGDGYNMDDGGKCNSGYWATRTDEQKADIHKKRLANRPSNFKEIMHEVHKTRDNKVISNKLKGRTYSEETINKMSESAKGRKRSKATNDKIVKGLTGQKRTLEQCSNISKATKGKKKSPRTDEHKAKLRKPVKQLDIQGNFITLHESVSTAGKVVGVDYTGISNCANGKLKTSGGFKWEWKNKDI
jgi:group I intron endonuclease